MTSVRLQHVLLEAVTVRPLRAPLLRTVEHLLVERGVRCDNNAPFITVVTSAFDAAFGEPYSDCQNPPLLARVRQAQASALAMLKLLLRCGGGAAAAAPPVGTREEPVLVEQHGLVGQCTLGAIANLCERQQDTPRECLALPEALMRELLGTGVQPTVYAYAEQVTDDC